MIRFSAFALALALSLPPAGGPALARTDPARFDQHQLAALQQLNTWLRGVVTLQGTFTQKAPDGTVTHGRFFLEKPGRLRFEYAPPSRLQIVADGFWVAVQDRKLRTTEKYPLATTPLKLLLDNDIDLLRDADIEAVLASETLTTVVLEEGSGEAAGELALNFDPNGVRLQRWIITDVQGLRTTITLDDTVANAAIDRSMFNIIEERIIPVDSPNAK